MSAGQFAGKAGVVVGATSGLGLAVLRAMTREGRRSSPSVETNVAVETPSALFLVTEAVEEGSRAR